MEGDMCSDSTTGARRQSAQKPGLSWSWRRQAKTSERSTAPERLVVLANGYAILTLDRRA